MDNINSFVIYLGMFFMSLFLITLADVQLTNANKKETHFYKKVLSDRLMASVFMILACVIPCLLASVRANSVGSDIAVYVTPVFDQASQYGMNFGKYLNTSGTEFLFCAMMYLCSRYANIHVFYFLIELLVILPVFMVLYNNKSRMSMTYGMAIYYLLFYNLSLCVMRQSIAMGFLLLAYDYLSKDKIKKALVALGIACLFHNSAIIITFVYLIVYWISKTKKSKRIYIILSIVLFVVFIYYFQMAKIFADVVSYISSRYAYYIRLYIQEERNWSNVPATDMICKSLLIAAVYIMLKITKKFDNKILIILIMVLIGRYFVLFTSNFYESMRLAFYFDYFLIIFVPLGIATYKRTLDNFIVVSLMYGIPAFAYWFYFIMTIGGYGTNIYKFYWN